MTVTSTKDILAMDLAFEPNPANPGGPRFRQVILQESTELPDWFILRVFATGSTLGIVFSRDEARHLALAILGEVAQDDLEDILHINEHLRELDAIDAAYLGG